MGSVLGMLDPLVRGSQQTVRHIQTTTPQIAMWFASTVGLVFVALFAGLFVLFLIHQGTIWLSQDPETAFHAAKVFVYYFAQLYDTTSIFYNALREVLLLLIPVWNGISMYAVQPLVYVAIEVISLTFSGQKYNGVLTEEDVPFGGHLCGDAGGSGASARWCGIAASYADSVGFSKGENGFVANDTLLLSPATARRLSEAAEDLVEQVPIDFLSKIIFELSSTFLPFFGTVSDIFFHIAYELASVLLPTMINVLLLVVRSLGAAIVEIFSNNVFTEILSWGFTLLIIIFVDILIPIFFRALDSFFCIMDYFDPSGWAVQLDCVQNTCYNEHVADPSVSDDPADVGGSIENPWGVVDAFYVFSSFRQLWDSIIGITEKVVNKATGQNYDSTAAGGTEFPNIGDLAYPASEKAIECAACFNCKARSSTQTLTLAPLTNPLPSPPPFHSCRRCAPSGSSLASSLGAPLTQVRTRDS